MDQALRDFKNWTEDCVNSVNQFLNQTLPTPNEHPSVLHDAMRYATLSSGKRIRPLLCYAAGWVTGAPPEDLRVIASSIELIHAYSLIHDDLPAMDNDVLRRGQPTCHVKFGEAIALLAGDTLQTLSFEWLAEKGELPPEKRIKLISLLSKAAGSKGMGGGQAIDLLHVNQTIGLNELENMHHMKTGALIEASLIMGAHCGQALTVDKETKLSAIGKKLGLIFQIKDDLLDSQSDSQTLGKTAGKDAADNKPTYVSIMGVTQAERLLNQLANDTFELIHQLGERTEYLFQLSQLFVHRQH